MKKELTINEMERAYSYAHQQVFDPSNYVLPSSLWGTFSINDILSAVVGKDLNESWEELYSLPVEVLVVSYMARELFWATEDGWDWDNDRIKKLFERASNMDAFARAICSEWTHQKIRGWHSPNQPVYQREYFVSHALDRRPAEIIYRVCEYYGLVEGKEEEENRDA